jgi:hypothetical protein
MQLITQNNIKCNIIFPLKFNIKPTLMNEERPEELSK